MTALFSPVNQRTIKKQLLYVCKAIVIILFISCKTGNQPSYSQEPPRDTTITSVNSYSDLFFDSTRMQQFLVQMKWPDTLKKAMLHFYNERNFQYAWYNKEGFTEQVYLFQNMLEDYISYSRDSVVYGRFIKSILDSATQSEKDIQLDDSTRFNFEMAMSASFMRYARRVFQGNIPLHEKDLNWFIPRKRINTVALLDSFVTSSTPAKNSEPVNRQYKLLKDHLLRYYNMKKNGGFPLITGLAKSYKKGDSSIAVTALKKRLYSTEDYKGSDTTVVFTEELENAVKQYQRRHGLKEDGVAGGQTLKLLNEPVDKRIEQLLVNMERMRWIPEQPVGDFILVNIPQYRLIAYENGKLAFGMNIVVGTSQNKTVIFTGNIKYVVFSPYCNVPPGILKNETLPAIRRDPSYLSRHHMERHNGGVRQKPGPWNALGKVKFLFPNT